MGWAHDGITPPDGGSNPGMGSERYWTRAKSVRRFQRQADSS